MISLICYGRLKSNCLQPYENVSFGNPKIISFVKNPLIYLVHIIYLNNSMPNTYLPNSSLHKKEQLKLDECVVTDNWGHKVWGSWCSLIIVKTSPGRFWFTIEIWNSGWYCFTSTVKYKYTTIDSLFLKRCKIHDTNDKVFLLYSGEGGVV